MTYPVNFTSREDAYHMITFDPFFNENESDTAFGNYPYDDDDDEHDDDYGDDYDDDYESPVTVACELPTKAGTLGTKRSIELDNLVFPLIQNMVLLATGNSQVYQYDQETGCYLLLPNPPRSIWQYLAQHGLSQLSVKDVQELHTKISWNMDAMCAVDDFNSMPQMLNMESGVLDYSSGMVQQHTPSYRFTYCIRARYFDDMEPNEIICPTFDRFCQTSLAPLYCSDREESAQVIAQKRQLLLEMIGYICCDSNAGKCAMFLKGEPDSGKSVVASFITRLFDPELVSNIPLHKLSDRFNKAELFGKKLNVAGEIQGKHLSEIATFKSITGSDAIFAEFKGKDPFSFTPRCKLLFAGNALPTTTESDATKAFANRLLVLLFNHSIPKEKQDKDLLEKLWDERHAIFTLSMFALRELANRNYQFTIPKESQDFLISFSERGNSIHAFLKDCCEIIPEARTFNTDLLDAYKNYCTVNGLDAFSRKKLYDMLSGIPGITMRRIRIGSQNRHGHVGIRLKQNAG